MLWEIKGTQLALLGSVHMLDVAVPPLSDAAWRAFNTAERVVLEHDFSHVPDMSFAQLPIGQSLHAIATPQLLEVVQERCQQLSLKTEVISKFQPWFAALCLTSAIAKQVGLREEVGVERTLWQQAREQGKAIEFLEDTAAALRAFSTAPMEEQLTMLRLIAEDPKGAFLYRMIDDWKRRRADLILEGMQERLKLMPEIFRALIEDRNRAWLPRLYELAQDTPRTLVVVGALHTVGRVGLPALLRAGGCTVTAVDVSGE